MDNVDLTRSISSCFLCDRPLEKSLHPWEDQWSYECEICGIVYITREAVRDLPSSENYLLSGFTRDRTERNQRPILIRSDNAKEIYESSLVPRSFSEKIGNLLEYLSRKSTFVGDFVDIHEDRDYPLIYSPNPNELGYILEEMNKYGWIIRSSFRTQLTLSGEIKLNELKVKGRSSDRVFVAMWFSDETEAAYSDGIEKAITAAGYVPIIMNRVEHNDKIDDRIIAEIRKSAFLIADFTGQRGGVYFEAGYALGLGMPVIWTCRDDVVTGLHFDTRQYNHILWKTPSELYEKLRARIEATIV